MASHHHPIELDAGGAIDSAASTPRSDHRLTNEDAQPRVRFMCSFGGKILPRPHDNQLRYLGGDTRIVAVNRHTTFSSLLTKLSKLAGTADISVKYQLPNEDLDALITVTTDEDVENMMEEYDRFALNNSAGSRAFRLRLFLFSNDGISRTNSISSLLGGSTKREHWFLDALNGGACLERGRSEVSSVMSEVPDYLFGLDSSDDQTREPNLKTRPSMGENVPNSDPGSPAPAVSSPFRSTSSSFLLVPPVMPSIPELPPVKTKPQNPVPVVEPKEARVETFMEASDPPPIQQPGYGGNQMWQYVSDHHYPGSGSKPMPVYYVPGTVPPENIPVQIRGPYVQQFHAPTGQVPVGFNPHVPGMSQVIGATPMAAVNPYGMNQPVYYGVRNAYSGMVVPGGDDRQVNGS
ncbi:hypothetical protein U1Q18_009052 [Sarracenia purpurea var. burkii]